MIVRQAGLTNSQSLVYDAENRLVRFSQANTNLLLVKYGYAADGARLWKWDNQAATNLQVWIGNIYEEKGGKVLYHVYAGGQLVCSFETNSTLFGGSDTNRVAYYYHEDDLNSSTALSSGGTSGSQIEVNAYFPFGRVMTASPQANFKVSRQFTGQVKDDDTGLYYYNARYYDPLLGRFIQGAEMKAGVKATEKIADEALVVRGGRNLVEDIKRGTGKHPAGVVGVSVESAEGKTVKELSENIPHGQVGVTTVGDERQAAT
jgi:RHS repeat-associated protein